MTLPAIYIERERGEPFLIHHAAEMLIWPEYPDGTCGIVVRMPDGVFIPFPRCTVNRVVETERGIPMLKIKEHDWVTALEGEG